MVLLRRISSLDFPSHVSNVDNVLNGEYTTTHSELPGIIYSRSSPGPGHFSLDMGYLSYVC